ncbi:MAG: HAD hydrolase family protein [Planctomycetes bacterium]|nr:HAD hydrolase family protein [Planctomycetota bacterium]
MDPASVQLVFTDVDGVLTDGRIVLSDGGEELKHFSVLDGLGVRLLQSAGIPVGFLSSRESAPVEVRARSLGVRFCAIGVEDKRSYLLDLFEREGFSPEAACFVGDDLVDIPCLHLVGFPVAVANARQEVKECAEYVTRERGGHGAFREVAELILKARGDWEKILERYR